MTAADLAPVDLAHVLVVDDDARLRELLRRYLSEHGFRVTAAKDAREARQRMADLAFDLIVLDVMMPEESGLELTQDLRRSSQVPILLLTAMGEVDDRIRGLESGADDYLAKPFEPRELVLRMRTILKRALPPPPVKPAAVQLGDIVFESGRQVLRRGETLIHLTQAEAALLTVFAERLGVTLTRDDLSTAAGIAQARTVDVQVTRLRRKIEPDPKFPRYLQTVRGKGYVLQPD
jgi:two-component system phosphate regulon response regulator OmpR